MARDGSDLPRQKNLLYNPGTRKPSTGGTKLSQTDQPRDGMFEVSCLIKPCGRLSRGFESLANSRESSEKFSCRPYKVIEPESWRPKPNNNFCCRGIYLSHQRY